VNRTRTRAFIADRNSFLIGRRDVMSDDKSKRGPQDSSRINMGEDYEVEYWTSKFGVSKDRLQVAVDRAGVGADAVARELGKASG
jgi:hypothetical protein